VLILQRTKLKSSKNQQRKRKLRCIEIDILYIRYQKWETSVKFSSSFDDILSEISSRTYEEQGKI
jgi:hypothetical protein